MALKTIKEMQDDLAQSGLSNDGFNGGFSGGFDGGFQADSSVDSKMATLQAQKNAIKAQVEQTQKILNNEPLESNLDSSASESAQMPTLRRAKTIKESMKDMEGWLDDDVSNTQSSTQNPQNLNTQPSINQAQNTQNINPQTPPQNTPPQNLNTQTSHNLNAQKPQTPQTPIQTPPHNLNAQKDSIKPIPTPPNLNTAATPQTPIKTPQNTPPQAPKKILPKEITDGLEKIAAKEPQSNIAELKQEKYEQIMKANAQKQETWLLLDEFLRLSGLEKDKVMELINDKSIKSKIENDKIYVEASTGTSALIKKVENRLVSLDMSGNALDPVFVEKTIATILGLHDKVTSAKDETIAALKSENSFLKEALVSMQEIYDDDKKTIELLQQQLQKAQEEVEFVKRKYKLMWGRVSNSAT